MICALQKSRAWGVLVLAVALVVSSFADAAPINYGGFTGGTVMFLDVIETANTPDESEPFGRGFQWRRTQISPGVSGRGLGQVRSRTFDDLWSTAPWKMRTSTLSQSKTSASIRDPPGMFQTYLKPSSY